MCKNYRIQRNVIELATAETPEVYAVYVEGPVRDLVGIVKVFNKSEAILCDVFRYGDTEPFRKLPVWGRPSNRTIAKMFDLTHMYEVEAC